MMNRKLTLPAKSNVKIITGIAIFHGNCRSGANFTICFF